jgi:phospholipid/cholesterol/gamma-HCH transport system substrate-binding protein
MSQARHAGKVGLFVVIGVVLIAVLMLNFSRGVGMFKPKYEVKMRMRTVAGLKTRSAVLLSGVQIGNVDSVQLDEKNKSVIIHLKILKQYAIRNDAKFTVEQLGVLGDQFVTILPGSADAPLLKDGEEVQGIEPFNLTEVARSANDLLKQFRELGSVVEEAVKRVNSQVLDTQTLSNLSLTIANFRTVSENTMGVISDVGGLVTNNAPAIGQSLSNLLAFTDRMHKVAGELDQTVAVNRNGLEASMKNLQQSTESLRKMTADVESGHGVVGGLLRDEKLKGQLAETMSNLAVLSSNLNRFGLLYKPKQPKNTAPPAYPGKSEFK